MEAAANKKQNTILFILALAAILGAALMTSLFFSHKNYVCKPGQSSEYDKAICQAQALYDKQALAPGNDFSDGPCLSNDLLPGWVADIVHNPRQPIDDMPSNQCQAFIEGRANHFVELDLKGKVIRIE